MEDAVSAASQLLASLQTWAAGPPDESHLVLALALGLAAGAGGLWLASLRPLRRRAERAEGALVEAREDAAALDRDLAVAEARAGRLDAAEAEIRALRERLSEAAEARAELKSALETERRQHGARVEELRRMEGEVEQKFAALAADALGKNAESFLGLVSERFAQHKQTADEDLARRQKAIETLLTPIRENLGKFETAAAGGNTSCARSSRWPA